MKKRTPGWTSLALVAALLGGAATLLGSTGDVEARSTIRSADGKELFRGIILGRGPVADALPELWNGSHTAVPDTPEGAAAAMLEQRLVSQIASADPRYFSRFAADVTSGDHARIERALAGARPALEHALAVLTPRTSAPGGARGAADGLAIALIAPFPPTMTVDAFVMAVASGRGRLAGADTNPLRTDMAAALVAERLAAR